MEKITALSGNARSGAVVAIGNFDGVHRGHRILLERAKAIAQHENRPFGVLTFEPHPRHLFQPDLPAARLTPPAVKEWRLAEAGCDILYTLAFDWNFAKQTATDFIRHVLIDGLGAAHVVVGYDFHFGAMRQGQPQTLIDAGIPSTIIPQARDGQGEKLASSRIRECLEQGEIGTANALLGWEWEIWGIVQRGDQRGRTLGYPTANVALGDTMHPAYGVYAARVQIEGNPRWHDAAVNIGIRPMFALPHAQVEAYIFDFAQEIYGQTIRIKPFAYLRHEMTFDTTDALQTQMAEDCARTLAILRA